MKYKSIVTGIGEMALELFEECGSLIVFNDNAPEELREIAVLHTSEEFENVLSVGDKFKLGSNEYTITAIGDEAMHTLKEMGHCTLKFTGSSSVELPGQIELLGPKPVVNIGDEIIFSS